MDIQAVFEFLWAIITVVLRLFRIVPSTDTVPPIAGNDGESTSTMVTSTPSAPILMQTPTPSPTSMFGVEPVTASGIESFVLVYAPTNTEVMELHEGDIVDMKALDGVTSLAFNVKVNPSFGTGLVLFVETGRYEIKPPLAFCGDSNGDYNTCSEIIAGVNTVTATSFDSVSKEELATVSISFEIVEDLGPSDPDDTVAVDEVVREPINETDVMAGKWIETDPNADIEARHEACFVMVDNPIVGRRAILIGGRNMKRTDIFDPVSRTWTFGPTTPIELNHMQCVAAQGKAWVMAGWTGAWPREKNAEFVYVFDPATNEWSTRTALPESRRRGAAAAIVSPDEQTIWVSHGNNGGHESGDHAVSLGYLDAYDIATDTWTAVSDDAPNPRDHTGGALIHGRICVGGGRNGGEIGAPAVPPTDCYDLATGIWTEEAPMPDPRAGSSYGVSCDGKLLVAGGEGGGKAWNEVHAFDGTTWTTMAPLNIGRHGSGLAVDCVCNQIIIASGAAAEGGGPEITSVELYFPSGEETPCML